LQWRSELSKEMAMVLASAPRVAAWQSAELSRSVEQSAWPSALT
jgi:hypothetical protein